MERKDSITEDNGDDSSLLGQRTFHYTHFNRQRRKTKSIPSTIDRFYYNDKKTFQKKLKLFKSLSNSDAEFTDRNETWTDYKCIGYANPQLRFCTACKDHDKDNENELYFIAVGEVSQNRTTLCYGCLGAIIKDYLKLNGKK